MTRDKGKGTRKGDRFDEPDGVPYTAPMMRSERFGFFFAIATGLVRPDVRCG